MEKRPVISLATLFLSLAFPLLPAAGQYGRNRPDQGPKTGMAAPKVSAKTPDGRVVDLSSPARFTVLVFGSHT